MSTQTIEPDADAVAIGQKIHMIAWHKRVTQAELGRAIGVQQGAMSKKLRGMAPITGSDLMKIARVLGVDPGDLLPRLDSNQQPSVYQQAQVSDVCEAPNVVHLDLWRERKAS